MPPTLKRPAYHVWIDPRPDLTDESPPLEDDALELHHVVVHHGDQLRAELEAGRQGLGKGATTAPMHLTSLWCWSALVRTKVYAGTFQQFKRACVALDPDKDRDQPHTDPDAGTDELDAHPTVASTS
jgi:hypothetical protein